MVFKTRFAPSPTGRIHMGNVRTAIICWFYSKKQSGNFLLRIDDTDTQRSDPALIHAIKDDLHWLGLNYDECFLQSSRINRYDEITKHLKQSGLLYPCYETKEELDSARKALLKRGLPPVYRKGFGNGIDIASSQTSKPCWRFAIDPTQTMTWRDEIKGDIAIHAQNISDPIVIRQDGTYTYMLPSVIDDHDYDISHVVRGDDHLSNTALQIAMFKAINSHIPTFAHIPLLQDREAKLSKRTGSYGIEYIKEQGIAPEAIISYLLSLGSSHPQNMSSNRKDHIDEFDIKNYNKGACIFMTDYLIRTNHAMLSKLSFDNIKTKFSDLVSAGSEDMWNIARNNINVVSEFGAWCKSLSGQVKNCSDDFAVINEAHAIFDKASIWDERALLICLRELKESFGAKRAMAALRKALTGMDSGPELVQVLLVMGKENVLTSLNVCHK